MLRTTLGLTAALAAGACTTPPTTAELPAAPPDHFVGAQVARFDLVCKRTATPQDELVFDVVRAPDGSAIVRAMNQQELRDYETHTYMNAYMWTNGTTRYVADRMTGVLTVNPGSQTYDCEKRGWQRF